ncbi:MAG: hypothetical protein ACOYXT_26700 [Bacteroidota bacterium]
MKRLWAIIFSFTVLPAFGQLNNLAFENRMTLEPADSNKLFLGLNFLGFGRNNEYFDTMIDGYTLFGYQLNPYLSYHIGKNVRIDAGLYLQKDFGNEEYSTTAPTLSLKIRKNDFRFIFGTLEGGLNHRLIEPLYDFEKVLNNRLENGIQLQWINQPNRLFLDVWADWQQMIYLNDSDQEKFTAGLSFCKGLWQLGNTTFEVPIQLLISHQGGQIDNNPDPVTELMNSAAGLHVIHTSPSWLKEMGMKGYAVSYSDRSSILRQRFNSGSGVYLNSYVTSSWGLTLMISYWNGNKFMTPAGAGIFPSANEFYPTREDQRRELVMLRFLYDLNITEGLDLTLRAEPFYDTYSGSVQYSYGFYFNFYNRFFLLHAKQSR